MIKSEEGIKQGRPKWQVDPGEIENRPSLPPPHSSVFANEGLESQGGWKTSPDGAGSTLGWTSLHTSSGSVCLPKGEVATQTANPWISAARGTRLLPVKQ